MRRSRYVNGARTRTILRTIIIEVCVRERSRHHIRTVFRSLVLLRPPLPAKLKLAEIVEQSARSRDRSHLGHVECISSLNSPW